MKGCYKCGKMSHSTADCPSPYRICYNCYEPGHFKNECQKSKSGEKKDEQRGTKFGSNMGQIGASRSKGRALQITAEDTRKAPDVVIGISLINNILG